jgi:drug/metabolite transporter (DMT)-like permease
MDTPRTRPYRLGGVACIVLAVACFGALDTAAKLATATVPMIVALWVRCLVQAAATAAVFGPGLGRRLLRTAHPGRQVLRGVLLISTNGLAYLSLAAMPVAEFTAVIMLLPLVLTVLAAWQLHEPVSALRWLCVGAGFGGTLLVIRPGAELFEWATLLPLLLVAIGSGFQLLTRVMTRHDTPGTIHLYSGLTGLVLTSAALPFFWLELPAATWGLLVLMGLFGATGHLLLIMAYQRASVARLTPYLYLQILFGAFGGWLVFSHWPDALSTAGIVLIAAAGVFGTWLTGREMLHPGSQREAESSVQAIAAADEH